MSARVSRKASLFTESVIREMSRVCRANGGINLAQGFPDFAAPLPMKEAACEAIRADVNQYAVTWGSPTLRRAIATRTTAYNGIDVDPETDVTVCCGATEAMIATMLAVTDPGDEVVIFEPFYENYGPDCVLSGAVPRFVRLSGPDWTFDETELRAAVNARTRAIVVNTPHNPTGKVFSREELEVIADVCREHDLVAVTDEIYEYILYDGAEHVSLATLDGMADRTVTISGLSKTWSATGWRIGWCVASPALTGAIRKVHDFLTVGAPAPLQEAAAHALGFADDYFAALSRDYSERRAAMLGALEGTGLVPSVPRGAYYVMCDTSAITELDDVTFAMRLVSNGGVATVPGSSFFRDRADGSRLVRFCFAKRIETLHAAAEVLAERLPGGTV
ncbi:MAG: aminotransferase class I/II-fold pyridoxal phosphate-dependent enzyme [Planctomycetota bacterium]